MVNKNIVLRKNLLRPMRREEMDNNLEVLKKFFQKYVPGNQYIREEAVLYEENVDDFKIAVCIIPENQLSKTFFDPTEWVIFTPDLNSNGDVSYIRSEPTNISVGGVNVGATFNGTIQDALDKILYPFIKATANLQLSSPREKGTTQNISLTATVNPNDDNVTNIIIESNFTILYTAPAGVFNFVYVDNFISSNKNYSLKVITQDSGTIISDNSVIFVAPTYYGVFNAGATESDIKSLNKNIYLKSNRTFNFNPTLQRYYYAYPAEFGVLSSIIDQNGFNITSGFTLDVVNFTLLDSTIEQYYVYSSNLDTTQTNFQITFNF